MGVSVVANRLRVKGNCEHDWAAQFDGFRGARSLPATHRSDARAVIVAALWKI